MSTRDLGNRRMGHVQQIAQRLYEELVIAVIADIKALPPDCRQSGDDSRLANVWEEFKYQLQRGESLLFEAYEETIRQLCARQVDTLKRDQRGLLWVWSDAYLDWDDDDNSIPYGQVVNEAIVNTVYERICNVAGNEALEVDPDTSAD